MNGIPRIVGTTGLILLLIGGTGVVLGSYSQGVDNCESGSSISISSFVADDNTNSQIAPVPFDDLSPVEQRIFLEAYTRTHNISDIYQEWSTSRFEDIRAVTYQQQQYEISHIVTDCGISTGKFIKFGGIVSVVIGLGLFGIVGIHRAR